ncbi:MAG: hypothetical protein E7435_01595 [Ruminococcaceae bacterium]|nr:hypothetical protein [Oscillospiraceae bacterium]
MSASNKKKLRKEQNASKMTAKQTQAEKEAKQLKRYTVTFVSILAIILVAAISIVAVRGVVQSGFLQKNSIAAVVGDKELNAVELSYYYFDAIDAKYSEWYTQYSSNTPVYLQLLMNLDISKPLDEQVYDSKTGQTWASYFIDLALDNAKHNYVLCKLADEAKFELPESEKDKIDSQVATLQFWAAYSGYNDVNKYLGSSYCYGANADNYRSYLEDCALANAYLQHYVDSLTYTDEQIRKFEAEKLFNYNSYSYATCYLSYTYFLGEGTKDDKGNVTYTEEEKDAARAKAKEVAESLLGNKNFEELEMAVKALEVNKDKTNVSATKGKNILGSKLPELLKDWITNADRVVGESTVIANEYTPTTDEDKDEDEDKTEGDNTDEDKKEEEKIINGYYVVIFSGSNDNKVSTVDVHHLLQAFADPEKDNKKDDDGKVIYTDAEKAKAKEDAEKLLKEWEEMEGGKTLENFKKLVEKNTDDTASASTGGLYENISYDQDYVEPFLNWALDENRKVGDVELVETEFGYHIMYFAETNEMNYRDLLISEDMRSEDSKKWYEEQLKTAEATAKDMRWIALDTVISG